MTVPPTSLRFDIVLALPAEPEAAVGRAFLQYVVSALAEREIAPRAWASSADGAPYTLDALDWPPPRLRLAGEWRGHRVELDLGASAQPASFYVELTWAWPHADPLVDGLVAWLRDVVAAWPPGTHILHAASLRHEPARRGTRPPYPWDAHALVDVFDGDAPTWRDGVPEGVAWPLPSKAQRYVWGSVQVLRYARDPLTPAEIQRASRARARWLEAALAEAASRPATPHLECSIVVELPAEPAAAAGTSLVRAIPALLTAHGIGARAWTVHSDLQPGAKLPPSVLQWPQRPVEVRGGRGAPDVLLSGRRTLLEARVRWPWREGMTLIAPLVEAVRALAAALPAGSRFLGDTNLVPYHLPLRSLAPPRERLRWHYGALLDAIDPTDPRWAQYARLPAAFPPPVAPPVVHHVVGNLHVLQWAHDPLTLAEVQRAWVAQQRWLTALGADVADARWTEHGDLRVDADLAPRPPLTLYERKTATGYKAIVVEADGTTDDDELGAMRALRAAGTLPDGTPVRAITLVATSRDGALALEPRARAAGLGVGYARGAGEIWIVHPEGWEH